jgi:hypothetical protein
MPNDLMIVNTEPEVMREEGVAARVKVLFRY